MLSDVKMLFLFFFLFFVPSKHNIIHAYIETYRIIIIFVPGIICARFVLLKSVRAEHGVHTSLQIIDLNINLRNIKHTCHIVIVGVIITTNRSPRALQESSPLGVLKTMNYEFYNNIKINLKKKITFTLTYFIQRQCLKSHNNDDGRFFDSTI